MEAIGGRDWETRLWHAAFIAVAWRSWQPALRICYRCVAAPMRSTLLTARASGSEGGVSAGHLPAAYIASLLKARRWAAGVLAPAACARRARARARAPQLSLG